MWRIGGSLRWWPNDLTIWLQNTDWVNLPPLGKILIFNLCPSAFNWNLNSLKMFWGEDLIDVFVILNHPSCCCFCGLEWIPTERYAKMGFNHTDLEIEDGITNKSKEISYTRWSRTARFPSLYLRDKLYLNESQIPLL